MFEDNRTRKNKHVLITGGSRGIGAEAVRRFASRGASVAFLYRKSYQEAFDLSRETGALNVRCNAADPASVHAAMEVINEFFDGEIDVLICNAGITDRQPVTEIGVQRWREIIDTDLNSAFYCIREVLPGMIGRGKGSIILVSSVEGQEGAAGEVAYSAAKAGLIGLTRALAKEVGPSGIRVNCIAPGRIGAETDEGGASAQAEAGQTPLRRAGTADEVARVMEFLASEQAAFMTGQVLGVNGGLV
ncbi:MAG: SDR family oxidoreductase [Mogibacterium sp.]|nr:SDR family oxidoreductase [Mogibacterium sp.]